MFEKTSRKKETLFWAINLMWQTWYYATKRPKNYHLSGKKSFPRPGFSFSRSSGSLSPHSNLGWASCYVRLFSLPHLWWDAMADNWHWLEHQDTWSQASHVTELSELFKFLWQKLQYLWNEDEFNGYKITPNKQAIPSIHDWLGKPQSDSPLPLFPPTLSLPLPPEIFLYFLEIRMRLCCWALNSCCLVKKCFQEKNLLNLEYFQLHYHKSFWLLLDTFSLWRAFPEDDHQQT